MHSKQEPERPQNLPQLNLGLVLIGCDVALMVRWNSHERVSMGFNCLSEKKDENYNLKGLCPLHLHVTRRISTEKRKFKDQNFYYSGVST